jgi:NADH-quinone oxidoreductase subunit M
MFEHILPLILLITFISTIVTLFIDKKKVHNVAFILSMIPLVLSIWLLFEFDIAAGGYQFEAVYSWVPSLGISLNFALDGLSLSMVFLTALLTPMGILFSRNETTRPNFFFSMMLLMELGLFGVFMSRDLFLFYIFWELVLIPMFFLIMIWGGPTKRYAAYKFLIYTHVASLIMVIGIMMLYFEAGGTFDMVTITSLAPGFSRIFQLVVFGTLFVGFVVKMPVVPFHTWLPDAHVQAPTAGSMMLAGVMLKMGAYGLIRIALPMAPIGADAFVPVMMVLGSISVIYGGMLCLAQKDLKRMVAYSSINHMGMVLLGIACFNTIGLMGAVFMMFAHGLISPLSFLICGVVQHKCGTRDIPLLGGLASRMPKGSAIMLFSFMASLGLPGLILFPAEVMLFIGLYQSIGYWTFIPLMGVFITAAYYIWAMQQTLFGPPTRKVEVKDDVHWYESVPAGVLIFFIVLFGVMPFLLTDMFIRACELIITLIGGVI